jgi:uncharacterized protein
MARFCLVLAVGACGSGAHSEVGRTAANVRHDALPPPEAGAPRPAKGVAWRELDEAKIFAEARATGRFVLLDGAAEWCHWCHVMEATTYHDAAVIRRLEAAFIPVKVDVDARPDVEARYHAYGWPATVLFSPEGQELGKYQGYLPPAELLTILEKVQTARTVAPSPNAVVYAGARSRAERTSFAARADAALRRYYDAKQGGFGTFQKFPIGVDNEWWLRKARRGDAAARAEISFTLQAQAALIDPVFGGIYQYSVGGTWTEPHYEKLGVMQAQALDNYADAYALLGDARFRKYAGAMYGFAEELFRGKEGGFFCTQDADLHAHDPSRPFLDGHAYYALPRSARVARGIPRIDAHEYGRENGLFVQAYLRYAAAFGDARAVTEAARAVDRFVRTHAAPEGGFLHDASDPGRGVLHLADQVYPAAAMVALYEATHDARWLEGARALASLLQTRFLAPDGGFYGTTEDPHAAGVFATRQKPVDENIAAARFFSALCREPGQGDFRELALRTTDALSNDAVLADRGRILGGLLLALDEAP